MPTELVERGSAMRATWHNEEDVLVLSMWHDGECTGSVRLPPDEIARLGRYLITALASRHSS
jgi:hypothetical protein